jgi:hypothetical protein
MALIEVRRGEYVDDNQIDDPKCLRPEQWEFETFESHLLPLLKDARDEASTEVFEYMRAGLSLGEAVGETIDHLPARKTERLRQWVNEATGTNIFAYVDFPNAIAGGRVEDEVVYGLLLTTGGPRDSVTAREEIGSYTATIAPFWDFDRALSAINRANETYSEENEEENEEDERLSVLAGLFSKTGMVQIVSKRDYVELAEALGFGAGGWTKPGLYDVHEATEYGSSPRYSASLDDYEREAMKDEAARALEIMFRGSGWRDACNVLAEEKLVGLGRR